MGRRTPSSEDVAPKVKTSPLSGVGQATDWIELNGRFNISVSGTFVATVQLQRSFDGGVTAIPCTNLGAAVSFTTPATEIVDAPEDGVLYRLSCTAYTSGTIDARLSQ